MGYAFHQLDVSSPNVVPQWVSGIWASWPKGIPIATLNTYLLGCICGYILAKIILKLDIKICKIMGRCLPVTTPATTRCICHSGTSEPLISAECVVYQNYSGPAPADIEP